MRDRDEDKGKKVGTRRGQRCETRSSPSPGGPPIGAVGYIEK